MFPSLFWLVSHLNISRYSRDLSIRMYLWFAYSNIRIRIRIHIFIVWLNANASKLSAHQMNSIIISICTKYALHTYSLAISTAIINENLENEKINNNNSWQTQVTNAYKLRALLKMRQRVGFSKCELKNSFSWPVFALKRIHRNAN